MIPYLGNFKEDETVYMVFNTFSSDDPSASCTITNFTNTDVHIHKDDGLTQRNNASGITVSIDFDGITGSHLIKIDTSDDTVAGFWVTGKDYFVRIEGTTVDGATINAMVGHFSIENRFNEVDLTHILGTALTESVGGYLAAAFKKLFDVATPLLVASDAMRGTDSAALASVCTETRLAELDAANLPTDIANIPTVSEFNARSLPSADYVVTSDTIAGVTTVTNLTNAPTSGDLTAAMKASVNTEVDTALSDYGANTTTPPSAAAISDAVWDEVLTGASHNNATSAGRRLRQAADNLILRNDTCQAGGGNNEVIFDTGASSIDDFYANDIVILVGGTGVGQARHIDDYVGSTRTATVNRNWDINPDATTEYIIRADSTKHVHGFEAEAKAQINAECDTALADYDAPTDTEMIAAFTEIKGGTWSAGTDTLEHIRDKQTDIEADTNELQTNQGNWTTATTVALNAQGKLDVNAECDTALSDYGANTVVPDAAGVTATPADVATALTDIHLDHLLAADYDPASKPGVATALLNELVENDGGVSRYTANALEQAPSGGTNPNVLVDTTIASITSQTVFVLTAGSDDDDAYKDQAIVISDASNSGYPSVRKCSGYVGATKTVTLDSAPDFTIVGGDGVKAFVTAPGTTAPTVGEIRTEMDSNSTKLSAIETDTQDIQSRIPAALSGGNIKADVLAISGSTDAADHLEASAETIVVGAAVTGTLSTTQMTTDLTEATNDHYNGRIIIWTSGVLKDQATDVTDYDGATKKLIYTATTEAPSDGDTFVLV